MRSRGNGLLSLAAASLAMGGTLAVAAPDDGAHAKARNQTYIVQMAESPVSAYTGGIQGYAATKPVKGRKINPNSPAVIKYKDLLASRHDAALTAVGGGRKHYSYGYVFNGFAADLTEAQAQALARAPGVLAVTKDEARALDTATTPTFIGLAGPGGVWETTGASGEGVIIGIVDGGIWPEHPSLSDRTGTNGNGTQDGKLSYQQIPGWNGRCVPGDAFTGTDCNHKLIGARWYNAGWGGDAGIREQLPWEFVSPRDYGGHGTHTATTAGGNRDVQATGDAAAFGKANGIAPRARIAAYKVCWQTPTGGSCFSSDSVAAIDQAVADGVDVINFSISGSRTNFLDPVEVAFLFAADAGIFVAASAGNSGPTTATVAHPGPWLTTVANGTHNRNGEGSVTLGNGSTYAGASYANALPLSPIIDSAAAGLAGADPVKVELCYDAADNVVAGVPTPVLDPAKVAGHIVLCKRGATALVNKTAAVAAAGGTGAVIYNDPAGATTTLAILHTVPAVHVNAASGAAIKSYIASTGTPGASIAQSTIVLNAAAPFTATTSSRGPLAAGGGDLLKPDLMAPGTDILAGVAPPGNSGRLFDLYSGTSMSSPHVAGLAALFKELHPDWSPMRIKSALMTTGIDVLDGGTPAPNTNPVLIFRQGAGHVNPKAALDPGLVFDAGWNDWLAFLCGTTTGVNPATCSALRSAGYSTDASDLNTASIAIGDMLGLQTVRRKVTNVGAGVSTYNASISGMNGFTAVVTPASFTLAKGETREISVAFTRTTAAANAYTGGQLRMTDGTHNVRIPIVVRPVLLKAPAAVAGNGAPISYDIGFGYNGAFSASAHGLVPSTATAGVVADDPTNGACSLDAPNAVKIPVSIPGGILQARFSLFDADVTPGSDIDLCVFNGTTLVGSSGSGTSAEEVNLIGPAESNYTVVVHGWGVVGSSPFKLHTWLVPGGNVGNMSVSAPAAAVLGGSGTVNLSFSGLVPGQKYMGTVGYGGAAGLSSTVVRVDP